jgi:hypothetical protein
MYLLIRRTTRKEKSDEHRILLGQYPKKPQCSIEENAIAELNKSALMTEKSK